MTVSIQYWYYGVFSFLGLYLFHLLLWNRVRIHKHVMWLFIILFLPAFPIFFSLAWNAHDKSEMLVPLFTHFLLASNYLAIYPAFQASSPTVHLLDFLWDHKGPISEEVLINKFANDGLFEERKRDLMTSKLVHTKNGSLVLLPKGRFLAVFFSKYRAMLKLKMGEG